ncbi:MAG TPA: 3-oxoacyl-[acyl-carrier-protein] synthase III C-terminal domain-containing protein [Kofleriaceae bacterium]|nr:3-oxoacyl-[acyl-carrier-protein] synthase III C-terminal domain-containing protein [Kofleriaceae bacterium]
MANNVGILGLGMYLPPEIRRNDWWSPEVTAGWRRERPAPEPLRVARSEGVERVLSALAAQADDPFQGAVERRIMPDTMSVFDMEEHASRAAIERSGIALDAIDLVLTHTVAPDELLSNPACQLHHRLGLARQCIAMQVDAATYSFVLQLTLAESLIKSGRARYALLVQSCCASRLVDVHDPVSAVFGDGATAVVVGPVQDGYGILGTAHHADGRYGRSLVASVRGRRWFDEGRVTVHIADPREMQDVLLQTADVCKESVEVALADAKIAASEVGFLCVHQGTPWLRRVVQDYLGLSHARSIELFSRVGYLFSAILPASLAMAEQEELVRERDIVVMTGGGTGMTYGAIVLRWGGR